MNESTGVIAQIDENGAEIELCADELIELSKSSPAEQVEPSSSNPAPSASLRKQDASRAAANRYVSAPLIVAIVIIGAAYLRMVSDLTNQSTVDSSQHTAQLEQPAPERVAKGDPVRFANPFDTNEVFEFPAGTTETKAREAVAEVLRERAMSRQET